MYIPARPHRALEIAESLVLLGAFLAIFLMPMHLTSGRANAPSFTVVSDLLPAGMQVVALGLTLPCLRVRQAAIKTEALFVIMFATMVLVVALRNPWP